MPKNSKAVCIICRSEKYKLIYGYSAPDQYERAIKISNKGYFRHWVKCNNCKLYYSLYSRPKDALSAIYSSWYRNKESNWRKETTESIFYKVISLPPEQSETKYRVNWVKSQIKRLWHSGLIKKRNLPLRMLDIGGATGVFAYEFRDDEWKPYIIDPSPEGIFIERKFNIPYLDKSYDPGVFNKPFDLVSMVFVLEHVVDPISMLKKCRKNMHPYSLLYIEVPDAICFNYKSAEDDIFNSTHLWMFTPSSIIRLMDICNFQVYSLERIKTVRGYYSIMLLAGINKNA